MKYLSNTSNQSSVTISDLIKQLESLKQEHGELQLCKVNQENNGKKLIPLDKIDYYILYNKDDKFILFNIN